MYRSRPISYPIPASFAVALLLSASGCSSDNRDGTAQPQAGSAAAGFTGFGGASGSINTGGAGGVGAGTGGVTGGTGGTSIPGCGSGGGKNRGKTTQTVTAAGMARTFVLYEPSALNATTPVPLVIVPHGFTMSGELMFQTTGYDKIADREGFVVAYPDGQGGSNPLSSPWYVGTGICGVGGFVANMNNVDQDFLNEIIKFVDAGQCVDLDHIYITGFSMGGYFSHETACMNPAFRAAGPHSGGTHDLSACVNQHMPVIIFHFENDILISYTCATDARDKWIAHNGCNPANPDITQVASGTCEYYKDCPPDGQVALCHFIDPGGGSEFMDGHAWSGGTTGLFGIASTESASELGWAFFKKYAW